MPWRKHCWYSFPASNGVWGLRPQWGPGVKPLVFFILNLKFQCVRGGDEAYRG